MERRKFTGEFKREAVCQNKVAGVSVAQLSRDLGIHMTVLRRWVKEASGDAAQAFLGHGHAKPDQLEVIQLRREVAKLKAERDILKKAAAYFVREVR
jgi:transposase